MNAFAPLTAALLDFAYALRETGIPLTIGGGFGLHLKQGRKRPSLVSSSSDR